MIFTKPLHLPAFNPELVHDPVMLRAPTKNDHEEWAALREQSFAHLTRWEESWSPQHQTPKAFKRRLQSYARQQHGGEGLNLFVFRQSDNVMVGGITLSNIRYGAARSGFLGYWIGAPYIRCGYAKAAVRAVVDHAFQALSLNRVTAACQPGNIGSQKLLEGSGFAHEGLARDFLMINGAWCDHEIYALTQANHDEQASLGKTSKILSETA